VAYTNEVCKIDIISDSREQILIFKESRIFKLDVGDITTERLHNIFHIERKSGEDLYGTIIQGHARFRNEILRAAESNVKLVVYVECTREDFINKRFPQGFKRKTSGETLDKIISAIAKKYDLEFIFCHGRENMRLQMIRRFESEELKLEASK